nr:hypothetical protein [Tanacetum cinerariifolium]
MTPKVASSLAADWPAPLDIRDRCFSIGMDFDVMEENTNVKALLHDNISGTTSWYLVLKERKTFYRILSLHQIPFFKGNAKILNFSAKFDILRSDLVKYLEE